MPTVAKPTVPRTPLSRALRSVLLALVCVSLPTGLFAGALLEPVPAPEWKVSEWINGDPGQLSGLRGKIVIIEFFQLWCPTCNSFSGPLIREWAEEYGARKDVVVVSIHTVFEGHDAQSSERLRGYVEQKGMKHPVGVDAYKVPGDRIPITMDRFETGGTPHVVIVDRQGDVVFSHFGPFDPTPVENFIERLIAQKKDKEGRSRSSSESNDRSSRPNSRRSRPTPPPKAPATPPPSEGGADDVQVEASGTYKISFEQTDKSCGELIPPMDILAEVTVYGDRIELRSTRPYLGLRTLKVPYDPQSGKFEGNIADGSREKGVNVELALAISGTLSPDSQPPELDYEFSVEKTGAEPGWECDIEGSGTGKLSIPRRR
jgi:thiol-disulfide isomerase/thioredoxin